MVSKCIAKEAELITEWLTKQGLSYLADKEYVLCHRIRCVIDLRLDLREGCSQTR
jgi:hypothetical protein